MSVLPIGKNTIVYGSSDAGRSIHNSCAILSYKMQFAAKMLNLKKHKVRFIFILSLLFKLNFKKRLEKRRKH